jgi:UDP-glucose 4-epimerase
MDVIGLTGLCDAGYVLETIKRVPGGKGEGIRPGTRGIYPISIVLLQASGNDFARQSLPARSPCGRHIDAGSDVMTILVTGGAGYIGSHTVLALTQGGASVVVIDNLSTGFSQFLPEGVPLFIGDAADENLVENVIAAHGVDAIIHFAGSVVVPDSLRDPLGYYRNNTMTTRNLLNAAVRRNVRRFIFSSTAAVYGNPDLVPVPEEAPTRPLSPYGMSKLMTEIMLHDVAAAHDMRYVVLRYFNVAGADPDARIGLATVGATHLLKIAVEAATGQRAKIDVFGTDYPTADGSCIRDFIHVTDLAEAHRAALAYLDQGGDSATLNCGYGRGYSVLETIEAVRRASGRNFAVQYADRRPGDIMTMIADTARIRATFDWTPRFDDIDTIARHALAWEEKLLAERQGDIRQAVPA